MKANRSPAFRRRKKQIMPVIVGVVLVVLFCGYMGYRGYEMRQTKLSLEKDVAQLRTQITSEEERSQQLKEFEIYTHTKMYAEEVAKDILGYVYEGEIIFKPED